MVFGQNALFFSANYPFRPTYTKNKRMCGVNQKVAPGLSMVGISNKDTTTMNNERMYSIIYYNNNSFQAKIVPNQIITNEDKYTISSFVLFDIQSVTGYQFLDNIWLINDNYMAITSPDLNKVIFVKYDNTNNLLSKQILLQFADKSIPHEFKLFGDYYYCCFDGASMILKLNNKLEQIAIYKPPITISIHSFTTFDNNIFWIASHNSDIWKLELATNVWTKETSNFMTNYVNYTDSYIFAVNSNANTIVKIDKQNKLKLIQIASEDGTIYKFISSFFVDNSLIITSTTYQQIYIYNIITDKFIIKDISLSNKYVFLQSYYFNGNLYLISSSVFGEDKIDAIVILNNFNIITGQWDDDPYIIQVASGCSLHRITKLNNEDIGITATHTATLYVIKKSSV